jgi:hypothetical protein
MATPVSNEAHISEEVKRSAVIVGTKTLDISHFLSPKMHKVSETGSTRVFGRKAVP